MKRSTFVIFGIVVLLLGIGIPAWALTQEGSESLTGTNVPSNLQSGKDLNRLVDEVFTAQDVFRIDHYLGKETVQNLLALRFANTLFEPVWNGNFVDSVQITMAEDVGIGGRSAFYQATGAARDVLQNHLLQLLALTAMEEPVEFSAEEIRTEKLKVLRAISLPEDRKSTRLNSSHSGESRMPSSA